MKIAFIVLFVVAAFTGFSQDTLKIKQIDALVLQINSSSLPVHRDTVELDYPMPGFKTTTYLAMIVAGEQLLKYVNYVISTRTEGGVIEQMNGSNSFYFDQNKLIKVEEYLELNSGINTADWYYADDKPLYHTLPIEGADDRALLLLEMSKKILLTLKLPKSPGNL